MSTHVGFIGLGIMGRPQALNLLKAGHKMSVYARRAESMQPLKEAGATICESPKEVASQSDIIFIMVSDTAAVESVIAGDRGLIHGVKPGSIVVDMSTISPTTTKALAMDLAARNVAMLDAPVSGGEIGAVNGTLAVMVGGKAEAFEKVKPLLECMGKTITHVGDSGAGQVAKACNQIVVALTIEAVAEAMLFAQKNGVDTSKVRDALMGGFANSKILEVHGKRMLDDNYAPGFKTYLHQKDMNIVMQTAHQLGIGLPGASLVAQQFNALVGAGDGDLDSSAIMKVIQRINSI
jgi:2-hydroxy-3-oxopropionate reductase